MKHTSQASSTAPHKHVRLYNLLFVPLALLALYVLIPQFDTFNSAFTAARSADLGLIALAGLLVAGAVSAAAAAYVCLALKPIQFRDSLVVQTAGMLVNRLLPAGIGGMGLTADFLYKHKHSLARASAVVALNNTLTFFGHMLLLLVATVTLGVGAPDIHLPAVSIWVYLGIVVALTIILIGLRTKYLGLAGKFIKDFISALRLYAHRKLRLTGGLLCAMLNTACHTTALYLCMQAFNLDVSIAVALVALTGGVAVASVTPTPGGLLGAEAGLTAVMVSYDIPTGTALAVALSYRLVSYWLPLFPGAVAVWYGSRKGII